MRTIELGNLIKAGRNAKEMSQRVLAKRVKASQASVSAWETGQIRPDPTKLFALAGVLDLDIGELATAAAKRTSTEECTPTEEVPADA